MPFLTSWNDIHLPSPPPATPRSNEDKRMAQMHGILELVKGFDEGGHTDRIILAGDFNTDPCDTADGFKAEVIPWIGEGQRKKGSAAL